MDPYIIGAEQGLACPTRAELVAFCRGRLADSAFESVASHLSTCPECGSIFGELSSLSPDDTLANHIKQCLAAPAFLPDPAYEAMERAAKGLAQTSASTPPERPVERDQTMAVPGAIGPYELLAEVGRGGMGIVYRARHRTVRREVALKMIRAGAHAGREARARFRVEVMAIARIQHPNVVRLYEFGESGSLPYFTMEWVDGGSLANRLAQGPLLARAAAELVRTLALAVESAHRKNVVHRDLKPSNVLLTADGTPKISDLGLAKLVDDGGKGLTQSDVVLGTPSYMAPEQAVGKPGDVAAAADIYALGAILFEALTGAPPFKGATKFETLRRVREDEPVPPSKTRAGIPVALDRVCLRCLEKSATERYPSAQALAEDLDQWLQTGHIGRAGQVRRRLRALRRRWRTGLVGLMLSGGLFAVALRDPGRPLRTIQGDLRQGRPATLIKESGRPIWQRWRTGETKSQTSLSSDGSFTIHTWGLVLLELLPDPQTERYCFEVDVRHEKSSLPGGVGLFVTRKAYPSGGADIHFFTHVAFNDVRGEADFPMGLLLRHTAEPRPNTVTLNPRLCSELDVPPNIDRRLSGQSGPHFFPAGEDRGGWHRLALTVTPNGVKAEWDGQPFQLSAAEIARTAATETHHLRSLYPGEPAVQTLQPAFTSRGGLGLYLLRGTASFRAATVRPLSAEN